jgi:hypothetical protein
MPLSGIEVSLIRLAAKSVEALAAFLTLATSAISPLDDYVCRYPGQARADAAGEVLVRRRLPVDVGRDEQRAH